MATIRDVAREAGVGVGTVSRVLNGSGPASPAVRARVLAAAERLGFVPSRAAQSLITGRSLAFGVVLPDLTNPYFPPLARGVADAARAAGYATLLFDTGWDPEREREAIEALRRQRVDAAVIAVGTQTERLTEMLLAAHIPVVLLDRDPHGLGVPQVAVDDYAGECAAIAWARRQGHRSIGFLAGPRGVPAADRRLRAYLDAMGRADLSLAEVDGRHDLAVAWAEFDFERGKSCAADLLDRHPALTCLVAANDLSALGALAYLASAGIAVPGRCAVVGFDDIPAAALVHPALTTVRQPAYAVGVEAGRIAVELVTGEAPRAPERVATSAPPASVSQTERRGRCHLFPAELVVRESC